jgi:hypothetical protein
MQKHIVGFGIALAALVAFAGAQGAQAATTADTIVNLQMQDNAAITATSSITVTPTLAEIVADEVTTANNPITLTIDSTNGSEVTLAGSGGTLADADLSLSSNGGSTWVTAADAGATTFYSSSATQSAATVPVKVKISNLSGYEVGSYANTVTFTVVAAD